MTLDVVYAGLAPSTGHPSRFDGCLRDVTINGNAQAVSEKGKVRQGCVVANRCTVEGVCPKESTCQREWNRHTCKCHRGLVGPNCERSAAVQICPPGFWGQFPNCKKCACSEGFEAQCNKENGECSCPKFQFPLRGRCVNCECGYGATSLQCSMDGQCKCAGQASGRRCDRCVLDNHVLDPKSLRCQLTNGQCPSQIEFGVQWPTTSKGKTDKCSPWMLSISQTFCPNTTTLSIIAPWISPWSLFTSGTLLG
ncbi:laminin EGF-like protein, partial [Teladorsagia circumcincta]